jgi:capsular polysaccharide export protein
MPGDSGYTHIKTNSGLLSPARCAHPDTFIVCKAQPYVLSGTRVDAFHTMSSLTGFEAILRQPIIVSKRCT